MNDSLTWLHLSDLHCCPERTRWDAERVLRALGRDLDELAAEHDLRPDLIFFTGDAAFGELPGQPIRDQFTAAGRFFEEVRTRCDVERENVFLVPGNHDVHRGEISPAWTEWLAKRAETHALDEVRELMRRGGRDWQAVMARLDAYRAFLEELGYDHLLDDRERLIYVARRDVCGHTVAIAGLNSAWSCNANDKKGSLWLAGDWQVATAELRLEGAEVVVGLVHHPRSWFVQAEDPAVEQLFERTFDFHLHGHEHRPWVKPTGGHVRVAAGACYDRTDRADRPNGYNLVRLDFENEKAEVWLRAYDQDAGAWQQRLIKDRTDVHGVWHLDRLRCFERRPRIAIPRGGAEDKETGELEYIVEGGQLRLVDVVFDTLSYNSVLLLLAQEGSAQREVIAAIKARARMKCGPGGVLYLTPSSDPEMGINDYFAWLGAKQARSQRSWS